MDQKYKVWMDVRIRVVERFCRFRRRTTLPFVPREGMHFAFPFEGLDLALESSTWIVDQERFQIDFTPIDWSHMPNMTAAQIENVMARHHFKLVSVNDIVKENDNEED
jgi:hypothetical protein